MITDDQIIEAGRVLLQARKERGVAPVGEVPASVSAALGNLTLPQDDAIARGPSSPLSDSEVDANLAKLSAAGADAQAKRGIARSILGLFGLGVAT